MSHFRRVPWYDELLPFWLKFWFVEWDSLFFFYFFYLGLKWGFFVFSFFGVEVLSEGNGEMNTYCTTRKSHFASGLNSTSASLSLSKYFSNVICSFLDPLKFDRSSPNTPKQIKGGSTTWPYFRILSEKISPATPIFTIYRSKSKIPATFSLSPLSNC